MNRFLWLCWRFFLWLFFFSSFATQTFARGAVGWDGMDWWIQRSSRPLKMMMLGFFLFTAAAVRDLMSSCALCRLRSDVTLRCCAPHCCCGCGAVGLACVCCALSLSLNLSALRYGYGNARACVRCAVVGSLLPLVRRKAVRAGVLSSSSSSSL